MNQERGSCPSLSVRALILGVIVGALSCSATGSESSRLVPGASCGAQDRTETVQGQITLAERALPAKAYNCNLELVGQFEGEGADAGLQVLGDCAYYSIH